MDVDLKDLQALIDIANRALKSQAEARLLEILIAKWNAQQAANGPQTDVKNGTNSD